MSSNREFTVNVSISGFDKVYEAECKQAYVLQTLNGTHK